MKVKANFPFGQSNKPWVASVVEFTSAQIILLPVGCEPNRSMTGGGVWVRGVEEEVDVQ